MTHRGPSVPSTSAPAFASAPASGPDPFEADVAVIGAGWAGLAAAMHLVDAGRRVTLLDAAREAGGRARAVTLDFGSGPVRIDAGQHLLVGAYGESLALAQRLHDGHAPIERWPMALRDTGSLRFEAAPLPAPWHLALGLLRARGLGIGERLAIARLMQAVRRPSADAGETVAAMLMRLRQPPALVERLWAPLCMAALNTDIDEACALTFSNVLRETLGGARGDSDFVLPRGTLAELISEPASRWLAQRDAALLTGAAVGRLQHADGRWQVDSARGTVRARQLIVAIPPVGAARLLQPLSERAQALAGFDYDAIATVYVAWPRDAVTSLPRWIMLREQPARMQFGQWLFDRGELAGLRVAAIVVSARGRRAAPTAEALADGIQDQLAEQLRLPPAAAHRVVTEKRATFRCTPGRPRIGTDWFAGELPGLWLAGDHAYPAYPATLEGAVRSGRIAAEAALASGAPGAASPATAPRS